MRVFDELTCLAEHGVVCGGIACEQFEQLLKTPWLVFPRKVVAKVPWRSLHIMWRAMVLRGLRSCHEVLGLTPQASKEELKLRYHELARSLHPDVCPGGTKPFGCKVFIPPVWQFSCSLAGPRVSPSWPKPMKPAYA